MPLILLFRELRSCRRKIQPGTERVQALADTSRSGYVVIANESRTPIANPLNSAQLGAPSTIPFPKLHPGPRSSVGMLSRCPHWLAGTSLRNGS